MKQTYLQKLKLVKYTVNSTVHRNPEHRAKCSFYRPVANTGHQTELNKVPECVLVSTGNQYAVRAIQKNFMQKTSRELFHHYGRLEREG